MDRAYIDRKFAELRADMITVMEAKFRAVQNNQEKIISLLGNKESQQAEMTKVNDKESMDWKTEMSSRVNRMVKDYPELFPTFNSVVTKVYRRMRNDYGFVSEQAIKDYKYAHPDAERVTCLGVISEEPDSGHCLNQYYSTWERKVTKRWSGAGWQKKQSWERPVRKSYSRSLMQEVIQQTLDAPHTLW